MPARVRVCVCVRAKEVRAFVQNFSQTHFHTLPTILYKLYMQMYKYIGERLV